MSVPSPVRLTLHLPETAAGRNTLSRRISAVHAAGIVRRFRELSIPDHEKQAHLQVLIRRAETLCRSGEP